MTMQVRDTVRLEGEQWDLLGHTGPGGSPFDIERRGLKAFVFATSCWRGHVCFYSADKRLRLLSLKINLLPQHLRLIRYRPPIPNILTFDTDFLWHYFCRFTVDYTGRLLLGMGYREQQQGEPMDLAMRYQQLKEVAVESGWIIGVEDLTKKRDALIEAVLAMPQPDPQGPTEDYMLHDYAIRKRVHDDLLSAYHEEPSDPRPAIDAAKKRS